MNPSVQPQRFMLAHVMKIIDASTLAMLLPEGREMDREYAGGRPLMAELSQLTASLLFMHVFYEHSALYCHIRSEQ